MATEGAMAGTEAVQQLRDRACGGVMRREQRA
jgi:hypothetical protein